MGRRLLIAALVTPLPLLGAALDSGGGTGESMRVRLAATPSAAVSRCERLAASKEVRVLCPHTLTLPAGARLERERRFCQDPRAYLVAYELGPSGTVRAGGQARRFDLAALRRGSRWPARAGHPALRLPAGRVLGATRMHGGPARVLDGGGGTVLVVWNEAGNGYLASVRLAGAERPLAVRAAIALAAGMIPTPVGRGIERAGGHGPRMYAGMPLGRSTEGRRIEVTFSGSPGARWRLAVFGCIHGDECAGRRIAELVVMRCPAVELDALVVPDLNPDGRAGRSRLNGRGVDLNRNFPSGWRPSGRPGDPEHSGPRPLSEPETRLAAELVRGFRPRVTIWYHQHAGPAFVRAWGPSIGAGRRYAELAGIPFRALPWLAGTAPNWQNHAFPGTASFVVELPPGKRLAPADAEHHASAVERLAAGR